MTWRPGLLLLLSAQGSSAVAPLTLEQSLREAAEAGDVTKVSSLLDDGVDVNAKDRVRALAVSVSTFLRPSRAGPARLPIFLLTHIRVGADGLPDIPQYGDTALMYASTHGHISVVQILLLRGAELHAANTQGETARDHARRYNEPKVEHFLKGREAMHAASQKDEM